MAKRSRYRLLKDSLLETLVRWGITTLGQLAMLPPIGLVERLGEEGSQMRLLALGQWTRSLQQAMPPEEYAARVDLEPGNKAGRIESALLPA
ncbi:MAG: hypothetical protein ABSG25_10215 [Bryobacteraceae bacterium]